MARAVMRASLSEPVAGRLIWARRISDGTTLGVIGIDACSGMAQDQSPESAELRFNAVLDGIMDPEALAYVKENFIGRDGWGREPAGFDPSVQAGTAPMGITGIEYDAAMRKTRISLGMDLDRVQKAIAAQTEEIRRKVSGYITGPQTSRFHLLSEPAYGTAATDPLVLAGRIASLEAQNYLMNGRRIDASGGALRSSDIEDMARAMSEAAAYASEAGGGDRDDARRLYKDTVAKLAEERGIGGQALQRMKAYTASFRQLSDTSSGEPSKLVPAITGGIAVETPALLRAVRALSYAGPQALYTTQALYTASAMKQELGNSPARISGIERFPNGAGHWPSQIDTLHGVAGMGYGNIKCVDAGGVKVYCTDHLADAFQDYAFELNKQYTDGRDNRKPMRGTSLDGELVFNGACGDTHYVDAAGRGYVDKGRGPEPELTDGFHVVRNNKDFLLAAYDDDGTRYACKGDHYFIKADRDLALVHHNRPGSGFEFGYPHGDVFFKVPAGSWVDVEAFECFRSGRLDYYDVEHLFEGDIVPEGQEPDAGLTVLEPGKKPTSLVERCERFDRSMSGIPGFSGRYAQLRDNQDIEFKPWPNEATGTVGRRFGEAEKRSLTTFEKMHLDAALSMPLMPESASYVPRKIPGLDYRQSVTDLGDCDMEDLDRFYADRAAEFTMAAAAAGAVPGCLEAGADGRVYVKDIDALASRHGHAEVLDFGIMMNTYIETKEVHADRVTREGEDTGINGTFHGQATWLDFAEKADGCKGNEFFEYRPVLSIAAPSPEIAIEADGPDMGQEGSGRKQKAMSALERMREAMARNAAREEELEDGCGLGM